MLSVEECINSLSEIATSPRRDPKGNILEITNKWDRNFINDVVQYIQKGQALSTAQGDIALKLIDRYRPHLVAAGYYDSDVSHLISIPHYQYPPYQSVYLPREVRWAGNNRLAFRCKYNANIVNDIKRLKSSNNFLLTQNPWYDRVAKLWIVAVTYENYEKVMEVIRRHNFQVDKTVEQYFLAVVNSIDQHSEVEVSDNAITIIVRNDEFLDAWMNLVADLEESDV